MIYEKQMYLLISQITLYRLVHSAHNSLDPLQPQEDLPALLVTPLLPDDHLRQKLYVLDEYEDPARSVVSR